MYNMSIGLVSIGLLVTGLLVFLAFNAHYGFWRKKFRKGGSRANNYKVEE
jgi:hypothetical protein